jgi:hypothetical protein
MMELAELLVPVLLSANEEAVVEAARAFGNLSREPAVREYMARTRVDELLVVLLDHGNREIAFSACGVLMNVASDERHKEVLYQCPEPLGVDEDGGMGCGPVGGEGSGSDRLVALLRSAGVSDLGLASVAAKALFNLVVFDSDGTDSMSSGAGEGAGGGGRGVWVWGVGCAFVWCTCAYARAP